MDTVTLLPEDVPGAVLNPNITLNDNSVLELKRWLECRGLKRTGTKQDLIERIQNCIDNGRGEIIFLGVDQGKWYDYKRNVLQQQSTANQRESDENNLIWARFPSRPIPKYFNKGHIYTYMFDTNVENEDPTLTDIDHAGQSATTVKPFSRGSQYVDSDYISEIFDSSRNNIYYCICKCQASFNIRKQYDVHVALNKTSGAITKCSCGCKQSALGKCSHVVALLLFLVKYVEQFGNLPISTTSKPKEWGKGSNIRCPGIIVGKYPMKRYKPSKRTTFNPLPSKYKRTIHVNNFLSDLECLEVTTMFQTILKYKYEDFSYNEEEVFTIKEQAKLFLNNIKLKFGGDNVTHHILSTFPQLSPECKKWRSYFITSINVKIVCGLSSDSARKNFILKNLWLLGKPINTFAMKYGRNNESTARKEFKKLFLKQNEKLEEYGLAVNSNYLYLASSIDGLVRNENNGIEYLIEIKCPKVLEKCQKLNEFDTFLSKTQLNNFFLSKVDNKISIKEHHPYLYQILVSLIIFNAECCKLVVWAPKSMIVIYVYKKEHLKEIEVIKSKVKFFYESIYVPEMFAMRCVRDLDPVHF